jgi:hypothetical protein
VDLRHVPLSQTLYLFLELPPKLSLETMDLSAMNVRTVPFNPRSHQPSLVLAERMSEFLLYSLDSGISIALVLLGGLFAGLTLA